MPRLMRVLTALCMLISGAVSATERTPEGRVVDEVLTTFHRAASEADGDLYFSLFAEDAIFIGTDASERWTVGEFRVFAKPYFSQGRGWTYTATARNIDVAPGGTVAWFDEILWNETYGTCRGTGVLLLTESGWRIAQYHLAFPIPNDLSREITSQIKGFEAEQPVD